jgi:hypothetical protein
MRHNPELATKPANASDQDRYVMIVSTRSPMPQSGWFCRCHRPNTFRLGYTLCSRYRLPPSRRSSRSQAIITNPLARFTPRSLSSSLLAPPSTRHAPVQSSIAERAARPTERALPRFRALALFGRRPAERVVKSSLPTSENLHNSSHSRGSPGALRSRSQTPLTAIRHFG